MQGTEKYVFILNSAKDHKLMLDAKENVLQKFKIRYVYEIPMLADVNQNN